MDLFLDTSVLLSACASAKGASRFIIEEAQAHGWQLISAYYCREETRRNLDKLGEAAGAYFSNTLERQIDWRQNALTSDNIIIFDKAKDRPVLISALSVKPSALLTLDRADFTINWGHNSTVSTYAHQVNGSWKCARLEKSKQPQSRYSFGIFAVAPPASIPDDTACAAVAW